MTARDPVLARLSELPVPALPAALRARILPRARAKLAPRPLSPLWTVAVSASVVGYLGWALVFTTGILGAP